jgi:excisionase family DNA binding protein
MGIAAAPFQEATIEGRDMLTVPQVSTYLQVHPATVRKWLREGVLRGVNLGGKGGWRIRRDELERFIAELGLK